MIRVTLNYRRFAQKKQRFERALAAATSRAVLRLAEEALEERYVWKGKLDLEGGAYGRLERLGAVFVPVTLKHQRRERWPDLQPIYNAMIRRGQSSYHGNRLFWVDKEKLDALRERLIAGAARNLSPGEWEITLSQSYHDLRVTIRKRGRATAADARAVEVMKNYIQGHFAEAATGILRRALREAGWE